MARSRAAAAASEGPAADEDAQQEVTVLMIEQLPALLTMYQAEPMVVSTPPPTHTHTHTHTHTAHFRMPARVPLCIDTHLQQCLPLPVYT
jgi:hypothetical protein